MNDCESTGKTGSGLDAGVHLATVGVLVAAWKYDRKGVDSTKYHAQEDQGFLHLVLV